MMKKLLLISILSGCFVWQTATAYRVRDLYTGTVPVQSKSAVDRARALPQAMLQVLVKVSGNPKVDAFPLIDEQLKNAVAYLQQYSYQHQDEQNSAPLLLRVQFEKQGVQQILKTAGQAIWAADRPQLVTWVNWVHKQGADTELLNNNTDLARDITRAADTRGVALIFPMLDLQDMAAVSVADVAALHIARLEQAAERYGSQNLLIGQLVENAENAWQATWILVLQGQRLRWQFEGESAQQVIQAGINRVANAMAARFAVVEESQEDNVTYIRVANLENAVQYAKVMKYLQGLAVVKDVEVMQVAPTFVVFQLQLNSSLRSLEQAIALNTLLQPTQKALAQNNLLEFQLE